MSYILLYKYIYIYYIIILGIFTDILNFFHVVLRVIQKSVPTFAQ